MWAGNPAVAGSPRCLGPGAAALRGLLKSPAQHAPQCPKPLAGNPAPSGPQAIPQKNRLKHYSHALALATAF